MTETNTMKTPKEKAEDWESTKIFLWIAFFFFGFIGLFVLKHLNAVDVVNTEKAGLAVTASYDTGFIINTTKVETTTGVYLVNGTTIINKGDELVIETRRNKDKYLCDEQTESCSSLYH